jgi:hypothetical protein
MHAISSSGFGDFVIDEKVDLQTAVNRLKDMVV